MNLSFRGYFLLTCVADECCLAAGFLDIYGLKGPLALFFTKSEHPPASRRINFPHQPNAHLTARALKSIPIHLMDEKAPPDSRGRGVVVGPDSGAHLAPITSRPMMPSVVRM